MESIQNQQLVRSFNLFGTITDETAKSFMDFVGQIIQNEESEFENTYSLNKKIKIQPITLYINTPGGSVTAGVSIIDGINILQSFGIEVIGVGTGSVMSMGIPILIACNTRKGMEFTEYMIHGVSCGNYDYLSKSIRYLEFVKKMEDKLNTFMVKRTKMTQEFLDKYKEDEFFFDTEKAKELGIINCIEDEKELTENDFAINTIKNMTKKELKECLNDTSNIFNNKLDFELQKEKIDYFLVNAFETAIDSCNIFLSILEDINSCYELDDTYAIAIYDLISPLIVEDKLYEE